MQFLLAIRHFPHQKIHRTFALRTVSAPKTTLKTAKFSRGLRPRTPANALCRGGTPPPASQDPPRDAQLRRSCARVVTDVTGSPAHSPLFGSLPEIRNLGREYLGLP